MNTIPAQHAWTCAARTTTGKNPGWLRAKTPVPPPEPSLPNVEYFAAASGKAFRNDLLRFAQGFRCLRTGELQDDARPIDVLDGRLVVFGKPSPSALDDSPPTLSAGLLQGRYYLGVIDVARREDADPQRRWSENGECRRG
jgi:hypothetical protein